MTNVLVLAGLMLLLGSACHRDAEKGISLEGLVIEEIDVPSYEGGEPNLTRDADGNVLLSWIEYVDEDTDALKFSRLSGNAWSNPIEIARGGDWFVNWADFPSLVSFNGNAGAIAAHWLEKSDSGIYDYDVRVVVSRDSGNHWGPAFIPYKDRTPAEHGFVSMLPLPSGRVLVVWLDGRNTKLDTIQDGHGVHGGTMTLRAAEFDTFGQVFQEIELDRMVCDCCQTDMAMTSDGPIVAYRNRTPGEIRDIFLIRRVNGVWMDPKAVSHDRWKVPGCPVNGPAVASDGDRVVVAWFTAAGDTGKVQMAFSQDAGETFGTPVRVDMGNPVGRVDVLLDSEYQALVTWIEREGDGGWICLASVDHDGVVNGPRKLISISTARRSGFPVLERANDGFILAWTDVEHGSKIRTVRF